MEEAVVIISILEDVFLEDSLMIHFRIPLSKKFRLLGMSNCFSVKLPVSTAPPIMINFPFGTPPIFSFFCKDKSICLIN
jgi:hypothetical protein